MRTPIDDMDLDDAWRIGMKRVLFLKPGGEPITDDILKRELGKRCRVPPWQEAQGEGADILANDGFQMGDTVAAPWRP